MSELESPSTTHPSKTFCGTSCIRGFCEAEKQNLKSSQNCKLSLLSNSQELSGAVSNVLPPMKKNVRQRGEQQSRPPMENTLLTASPPGYALDET